MRENVKGLYPGMAEEAAGLPNADMIALAELLLAGARSGAIQSIAAVTIRSRTSGGTAQHWLIADTTEQHERLIGNLHMLQMKLTKAVIGRDAPIALSPDEGA